MCVPFACRWWRGAGTRLVLTLMYELRRTQLRYGMASACIGGGQGIAILVRNPRA